ncbi:helix-turn-helix domain-containing protein [Desulfurococcus mucosus]|uniref:helix-turn-helix domain-containing protein n=1 Tax=Desulfurococcus mucosus TaxID=2275 RepID=UPI000A4C06BE|nr:helix-turn-helix domain-containing protein [Desulfurococcus mucosus]
MSYPHVARSIDIVACKGDTRVFMKISGDLRDLSGMEMDDLKKSGVAYNSSTLIVAERNGGRKLEDDVVYVRNGVNIVTPELLNNYLLRNNKPIVVNIKGNYLLKLSASRLHEKRKEIGLTRGELAEMLGVSRKTIYMYEKGELMISLQKGIELARVIGEDVFDEIDIFSDKIEAPALDDIREEPLLSDEIEETIWRLLNRLSNLVVKLSRTPVDIVAKGRDTITVTRLDGVEEKAEKLENAEKIARTTGSRLVTIETKSDLKSLRSE